MMLWKAKIALVTLASIVSVAHIFAQDSLARPSAIVTRAEVPLYPPLALAGRLTGNVHIHVVVERGVVVKAESDSPSQLQILINAATENVKTWRFANDARGSFDVTYAFELRGDEGVVPENPRIEMELPTLVRLVARPVKPTCQDCGPGPLKQSRVPHLSPVPHLSRSLRKVGTLEGRHGVPWEIRIPDVPSAHPTFKERRQGRRSTDVIRITPHNRATIAAHGTQTPDHAFHLSH